MSIRGLATEIKDLAFFIIKQYDSEETCDLEDYKIEKKLKQARALMHDVRKVVRSHAPTVADASTTAENNGL